MTTTLVAGATGYLGRHVAAELHRRGHTVRAIVRDRGRAGRTGPWSAPSLEGLVDEWAVGDVTDPDFTSDVAAGADGVVSALGVTRQGVDPWTIDNLANLALLESALRHGVRNFTYVNVLGGGVNPAQLTRAKAAFAQTLAASSMTAQAINPTGYFSDMAEVLSMARRGVVPLFRPDVRLNPIHGSDLAGVVVDRLEEGREGSWDVGGPDVLTWSAIAHLAFAAVGRRPRVLVIPQSVLGPVLRVAAAVSPQKADTMRFATWGMLHDGVAPTSGTRHLADFFAEHA